MRIKRPRPRKPRPFLSLRKIEIRTDRYQADLELHDRFLQFSAELLRMALGGVGVIGALVSLLAGTAAPVATLYRSEVYLPVLLAVGCFTFAAGAALAHRFLAADGMFHHFRAIKHLILVENCREDSQEQAMLEAAREDEQTRNLKFAISERMLFLSAFLLFGAVALLGLAVANVLLAGPPPAADARNSKGNTSDARPAAASQGSEQNHPWFLTLNLTPGNERGGSAAGTGIGCRADPTGSMPRKGEQPRSDQQSPAIGSTRASPGTSKDMVSIRHPAPTGHGGKSLCPTPQVSTTVPAFGLKADATQEG